MELPVVKKKGLYDSSQFEFLECGICYNPITEPTFIISNESNGQYCIHNFCKPCISRDDIKQCPFCRRDIVRLQENKLAAQLIQEFSGRTENINQKISIANETARMQQEKIARIQKDTEEKLADAQNKGREHAEAVVTIKRESEETIKNIMKEREKERDALTKEIEHLKEIFHSKQKEWEGSLSEIQKKQIGEKQVSEQKDKDYGKSVLEIKILNEKLQEEKKKTAALQLDLQEKEESTQKLTAQIQSLQASRSSSSSSLPNMPSSPSSPNPSSIYSRVRNTVLSSDLLSSVWWPPAQLGPLGRRYEEFRLMERRGVDVRSPVWRAVDITNNEKSVALKRIMITGRPEIDLREGFLLHKLDHDNIVKLKGLTRPTSTSNPHFYLILEYLEVDLDYTMTAVKFTQDAIREIMFRLLSIIKYLHDMDIVHLDIKPTSIIFCGPPGNLPNPASIKLASFSQAKPLTANLTNPLPTTSIYHWAPELIYMDHRQIKNLKALDIWSVGVLFGQLLSTNCTPLFPVNNNNGGALLDSITMFQECRPTQELIGKYSALVNVDNRINNMLLPPSNLASALPLAPPVAIDLLSGLLKFDANQRLSVFKALAHPYFDSVDRLSSKAYFRSLPATDFKDENILSFIQEQCSGIW